jgi:hypothetical protein
MTVPEFLEHIEKGERWFNNGSQRTRYVVGVGGMVMYKSKPSSNTTSGVWIDAFAKWAKGVGQLETDSQK